jgi:hypothetical protein
MAKPLIWVLLMEGKKIFTAKIAKPKFNTSHCKLVLPAKGDFKAPPAEPVR